MLTVIEDAPKFRKFLTYDFEWVPGEDISKGTGSGQAKTTPLKIRICGVYDGKKYRAYLSTESFLEHELTKKNRGAWFYGHAGGLADGSFVLGAIKKLMVEKGYQVSAKFSGSSAIIIKVKRHKHVWFFVDSYWTLRDKLENIAKWIGTEKGEKEKRRTKEEAKIWYAKAPLSDLITYNKQDNVILHDALSSFQTELLNFGGQMQMTLASSAMYLFRRKFLSRNIETSERVNRVSRLSYFASRVEPFTRDAENVFYYDINSSFPHAMTYPCPGDILGSANRVPDSEDAIFTVDCDIEVPDCYLPPIPIRHGGKVFFPMGRWRTWLTSIDFRLLQKAGGKVHRVYDCIRFNPFHDLSEYAKQIYAKRRDSKSDFEKIFYKLLLNSLYGKFAECNEKQSMLMNPESTDDTMDMYMPGVWLTTEIVDIPHEHVPISAHITAIARRSLYEFLSQCRSIYYCDTDGFATTDNLGVGIELGELKLEKELAEAYFKAPKVYRYQGKPGSKCTRCGKTSDEHATYDKCPGGEGDYSVEIIKAKGFSDMSREKFDKLADGLDIEFQRMARIKEMFGRFRSQEPIEILVKKCLKGQAMTKRFTYPDGTTRPWTYEELMSGEQSPNFGEMI